MNEPPEGETEPVAGGEGGTVLPACPRPTSSANHDSPAGANGEALAVSQGQRGQAGSTVLPSRWHEFWAAKHWRPQPVGGVEWFWLRFFFAVVVAWSFLDERPFQLAGQSQPNGIAHLISLTFLHAPHARTVVWSLVGLLLAGYVAGPWLGRWVLVTSLAGLTLLSTLVRTYMNSQGYINHAHQVVTLTLLAQTVTVAIILWWEQRKRRSLPAGLSLASHVLYYSQAVLAGTYLISAITKLINSRGLWVWNTVFLPLELVKSRRERYFSNLDDAFTGDSPHVSWMLAHPWWCRVLFGSGFFLELFALLALRGRPWALALGLALIGMHISIEYLMTLRFHFNVWLLVIFFVNPAGWMTWWWRHRNSRLATGPLPS
jgi:hypothetical protein